MAYKNTVDGGYGRYGYRSQQSRDKQLPKQCRNFIFFKVYCISFHLVFKKTFMFYISVTKIQDNDGMIYIQIIPNEVLFDTLVEM